MCWSDYDSETGYSERFECNDYQDACDKLYTIESATKELIGILYGSGRVDAEAVHDAIADLCKQLNMKAPQEVPTIARRPVPALFEYGVLLSRSLTHTGVKYANVN